jgi:hypothetical protein
MSIDTSDRIVVHDTGSIGWIVNVIVSLCRIDKIEIYVGLMIRIHNMSIDSS